jgi:hypothetical protein
VSRLQCNAYNMYLMRSSGFSPPSYSLCVDGVMAPPAQALHFQPQLLAQQQLPAQSFVPMSIIDQSGRQMLLAVSKVKVDILVLLVSIDEAFVLRSQVYIF